MHLLQPLRCRDDIFETAAGILGRELRRIKIVLFEGAGDLNAVLEIL